MSDSTVKIEKNKEDASNIGTREALVASVVGAIVGGFVGSTFGTFGIFAGIAIGGIGIGALYKLASMLDVWIKYGSDKEQVAGHQQVQNQEPDRPQSQTQNLEGNNPNPPKTTLNPPAHNTQNLQGSGRSAENT